MNSIKKYDEVTAKLSAWLEHLTLDQELLEELEGFQSALDRDSEDRETLEQIYDRFYRELEFGTGGLRGILGAGENRMNIYTVGKATQGFCDYLNQAYAEGSAHFIGKKPSVAVAYDSRIQSDVFAKRAAEVLAANNIDVYLYKELMPTPALSFAVRYFKCCGGIMVTASHNPAKYNGYKVYNSQGCQLNLEESDAVLASIEKVDLFRDVKGLEGGFAPKCGDDCTGEIRLISDALTDVYIETVKKESTNQDCSKLSVVYTPLNGTGYKPVCRILKEIGVKEIHLVEEQTLPDGNFPTCPYPNPEKKEALSLGLALCEKLSAEGKGPDLLLATDPDCDRVGIAVRHETALGKPVYSLLSGNETGVLLLDYLCQKKPKKEAVVIKTIVTTKMADAVAANYGVELRDVLTGFKFIGEQIGMLEKSGEEGRYLFGFEESYGYLSGAYVRDKDGVNAVMLICEMAAYYKEQGETLQSRIQALYETYGFYQNDLMEFAFPGAEGMEKMAAVMEDFRKNPPLVGWKIQKAIDYLHDETGLPKSDVLSYELSNGSSIILRPSGTEPKLKLYLSAKGEKLRVSLGVIGVMKEVLSDYVNLGAEAAQKIPRPGKIFY